MSKDQKAFSCGKHLNMILNDLLDHRNPKAVYDSIKIQRCIRGGSVVCEIDKKVPPYVEWEITYSPIKETKR